ncbi:protein-L-isoaspartate(D-aspartate) O-methyltransferase [Alkalicoccus halolimnae]|uniref:Protein-L-isoaspartate O-methyltransferase n=1 Tax=Alkalicoccus halolimnae TaxID=1667239 RepID=A0A5C7FHJ2_9BACI|nr:protein-L-isoaspartate(D-aspartate) O-methyltransferase [Alkalicoccus halolimnae]TXF86777.1 protein-L-isoaspartate(D-aspartate) O-methyltransferase [Alkalicoccus halolimnae]
MNETEKEIKKYFKRLDRSFYMEEDKEKAHLDHAFSIGYGQTISQPSLVLDMTLALDLRPEHKVLEIGTGSGFQTNLLARFSSEVFTIERIAPLQEKAEQKLTASGFENIHFRLGNGSEGWPEAAPFDRIMVTAAAETVPSKLIDQLKEGGKMIIPVGDMNLQELLLLHKKTSGKIVKKQLAHVRFVKLHDK